LISRQNCLAQISNLLLKSDRSIIAMNIAALIQLSCMLIFTFI
jgi:hypothetical protein